MLRKQREPELRYECPEMGCSRVFRREKTMEKHLTDVHAENSPIRCVVEAHKK